MLQADTISWSLTLTTRDDYKSVTSVWHDKAAAKRREVTAGDGAPALKLRHVHATEGEARQAAKSKLDEVSRGNDTFEASMPGDPLIAAEGRLLAVGFRAGVNGLWSITTATHELSASGYTTMVRTERPKAT